MTSQPQLLLPNVLPMIFKSEYEARKYLHLIQVPVSKLRVKIHSLSSRYRKLTTVSLEQIGYDETSGILHLRAGALTHHDFVLTGSVSERPGWYEFRDTVDKFIIWVQYVLVSE